MLREAMETTAARRALPRRWWVRFVRREAPDQRLHDVRQAPEHIEVLAPGSDAGCAGGPAGGHAPSRDGWVTHG